MLTAQNAFARGDFLSVARDRAVDTWQYWASLGLLGHPADAAATLQQFKDPDAAFYSAAASWIAGDDDRALHALERCTGDHAQRLAQLIRRQPITVLGQLPWARGGTWDIVTNAKDPHFRVLNVTFHRDDIANRPYADVRTLVPENAQIDFFVAEMVEWHLIPPNVRALGCPVLGHSSDFDLHVQTVLPWLELFDELIVLDDTQWRDMSAMTSVPVSVYPKVFGVPAQLPPLGERERDTDVYLSGTVWHSYHFDKDPVVLEVLGVPDIRVRIVSGFDKWETYYQSLAGSKICCTFVRHPGAMPTRGLEALGMGCAVAIQEQSALRLFAADDAALVPYDSSRAGSLAAAIQTILTDWRQYETRARAGAAAIRHEFALDRVASQYLRFLTVLAAKPRTPRAGPTPDNLIQKRPIVQKGWLPAYKFGQGLLIEWADASVARIERQLKTDDSARLLNDLAREQLLAHYHDPAAASEWLDSVVLPLERAVERFSTALVPRFNLIRILVHFGEPAQVRRAVALIDDTLAQKIDQWHVDRLDDVLPWDFCPSFFNYRRYFDTVVRFADSSTAAPELIATIVASLSHYRARYADEIPGARSRIDCAREAVRLDPDFVDYVLYYCRQLIARARSTDLAEAGACLEALTRRSLRLLETLDISRHLPPQMRGEWYADLEALAARFWSTTEMREYFPEPSLRSSTHAFPAPSPPPR
jgi:hypothetical protein